MRIFLRLVIVAKNLFKDFAKLRKYCNVPVGMILMLSKMLQSHAAKNLFEIWILNVAKKRIIEPKACD